LAPDKRFRRGSHRLRTTARPPHPRRSPPTRWSPVGRVPPIALAAAPGEHPGPGRAPLRVGAALERRASPGAPTLAHPPPPRPRPPRQGESPARV